MKSLLSWTLLVIYLGASVKILMPLAYDCMAHVFFLEQHLAEAHDGAFEHNHINDQLIEIVQEDEGKTPQNELFMFSQANLALHYIAAEFLTAEVLKPSKSNVFFYSLSFYQNLRAEDIAPPPKQLS